MSARDPGDLAEPIDPIDVRLAALGDATAAVRPSAGFVDRVAAAAATIAPPRPGLACGWRYAIPAAAMIALVAGVLAWRTQRDDRTAAAARELAAALADPPVAAPW